MTKTKKLDMELPKEGRFISSEFPILRENLGKLDQALITVEEKIEGKAPLQHKHTINDVTGLESALNGKMAADKTFTFADLSDIEGAKDAANNYVLYKAGNNNFTFGSAISLLGAHKHKTEDIVGLDAPNTTDEAALSAAKDFDSKRAILIDPFVKVNRNGKILEEPASAAVAGVIAKTDFANGFWHSPSNKVINGIVGTARPIDFSIGDRASRANLLNEQNITTIIRENGYRLWGNRTLSSDTKFAFLSVVRTADMINDAILRGHLWAVDRNIKKTYLNDVSESVNAYLRDLKAQGAILGGRCTPDLELNTVSAIEDGRVYFNVEFTPTTPAEHITFRSQIINDYLEEIF